MKKDAPNSNFLQFKSYNYISVSGKHTSVVLIEKVLKAVITFTLVFRSSIARYF